MFSSFLHDRHTSGSSQRIVRRGTLLACRRTMLLGRKKACTTSNNGTISSFLLLLQMVGIWCVWMWHELGRPHALRLVELGPGRGTLLADLLRSTATFKDFALSVSADLVEVSPPTHLL